MSPCRPPFSDAGIGEIVDHRSLDFFPKRFLQRAVTIVDKHSLSIPGKPGEERAEAQLCWRIKTLERLHTLQEHLCKLAILLRGFNQVAPLRRQNIDSGATALLVLLPNLNRKINQRRDDTNGRDDLSDRRKHFPVHKEGLPQND